MFYIILLVLFFVLYRRYSLSLRAILTIAIVVPILFAIFSTMIFSLGFFGNIVMVAIFFAMIFICRRSIINQWRQKEIIIDNLSDFIDYISDRCKQLKGQSTLFEDIPYNRAEYFSMGSNLKYSDSVVPIVFDAKPANNEMVFQEYGFLLTSNELIIRNQMKNFDKNAQEKFIVDTKYIPLENLVKVYYFASNAFLLFENSKPVIIKMKNSQKKILRTIFDSVIESGWSKVVGEAIKPDTISIEETNETDAQLERITKISEDKMKEAKAIHNNLNMTNAVTMSQYEFVKNDLAINQINGRFSDAPGHGYVAEQFGNALDRLKLKNANAFGGETVDGRIPKNGADRSVNGTLIQTKFCKTAGKSIGQCFDTNGAKYVSGGRMMKIEVPKDQYGQAVNIMAKKIKDGLVPNETNPQNAAKYVKKSPITYEQSLIATKSIFDRNSEIPVYGKDNKKIGTRKVTFTEKLYFSAGGDFITGASLAVPSSVILGVWVYCNSVWNGVDKKDALKNAGLSTMKPILYSGFTYMLSSQFAGSKIGQKIGNSIYKKLNPIGKVNNLERTKMMTKGTSFMITAAVTVGPDLYKCLSGKISSKQLIKNTTSATIGGIAGAQAGLALGSVVPVVGSLVGSIVGGTIGAVGSKMIMDKFVEDDAVQMLRIAKEEFINTVLLAGLTKQDFEYVLNHTFLDKEFDKVLKLMFMSENPREFIHQVYYELLCKVYENKELPPEEELLKVVYLQESLNAENVA